MRYIFKNQDFLANNFGKKKMIFTYYFDFNHFFFREMSTNPKFSF